MLPALLTEDPGLVSPSPSLPLSSPLSLLVLLLLVLLTDRLDHTDRLGEVVFNVVFDFKQTRFVFTV